jgi:hypothetical protein
MKIFLAFSFRPEDKDLVSSVERLVASHGVQVTTGERLGGEALTPEVKSRIDDCDALVAVLTRRKKQVGGGWSTHEWVRDELGYARAKNKKAIALIEKEVDHGGMYQPNEYLGLDQAAPLPAFLNLSETIYGWREALGKTVKVQILPPALAHQLGLEVAGLKCRHRLGRQGRFTKWQEVYAYPEVGGTFVHIEGVREDHLIQLEVIDNAAKRWRSHAASQWMQVELMEGGQA